ncbi:MAG TPA: DUF883 family protein [Verrucomicrobiae bacterium]|nr:DUF883 family protein [Verrucomicrobiae bacterium]
MEEHKHENNLSTLVQDARALLTATVDVAGDKVVEARNRLKAALDGGKELIGRVGEKTLDQAKAADEGIRANPYQAVFIALGVGALIGYLAARGCSRNDD